MLGVVFTEFLEMVETKFSPEMVDQLLDEVAPENGGAYTAVGYYPHEQMVAFVRTLSRHTGVPEAALIESFGMHLFGIFVRNYPQMFAGRHDAFELLAQVDGEIHREVRKLYPNAHLPRFTTEQHDAQTLVLRYESERHLQDLALGLIRACLAHFSDRAELRMESGTHEGRACTRFRLQRPS